MNKKMKIICGTVTAVTVLSAGVVTAFAATDGMDITKSGIRLLRTAAASEGGLIFKEKADGDENQNGRGMHKAFGSLTDAQMEALMAETDTQMKAALAELVSEGIITQDIADQLQVKKIDIKTERPELTDEQKAQMKVERPELTDEQKAQMKTERPELTDEQKAQMKAERPERFGVALNLTEEQQTAVKTAMEKAQTTAMEKLVSNGAITQAQADEIAEAKADAPQHHKAETSF